MRLLKRQQNLLHRAGQNFQVRPRKPCGSKQLLILLQRIGVSFRRGRQHDQAEPGHHGWRDTIVIGHELQCDDAAARGQAAVYLSEQCLAGGKRKVVQEIREQHEIVAGPQILLERVASDRPIP